MPQKRKSARQQMREIIDESESNKEILINNPMKNKVKLIQFPWTEKQKDFFRIALDRDTKIVFVSGPAGTSKTLLSAYCGLQLLNMAAVSDIMYLRSAVESSEKSLGYLPGDADEKLRFYNLPFLDKLDELMTKKEAERLEKDKRISMFPVNFARGMNWKDKCIILDEAQNSTEKEITTVLTRLGKNSRCFLLADPMQTDLKREQIQNGFTNLLEIFSDKESRKMGIHTFQFTEEDIMRSELVKFIVSKLNEL